MSIGYMYCFSNISMPGILKVGMTKTEDRTPDKRLREANASDTWRPPTPYVIEFAKKVSNPEHKEATIHMLLTQYAERPNPKREFFKITTEEVKKFFELMDGEWWYSNSSKSDDEEEDDDNEDDNEDDNICLTKKKLCRDMRKCFTDEQRIRHKIGITKIIIGIYKLEKNAILFNNQFMSLYQFTKNHYIKERPDRTSENNAWKECECEVNGIWISTYDLPELSN